MKILGWCSNCKERSVRLKIYKRKKDGKKRRCEHCINEGCGYSLDLPFPEDIVGKEIMK